MKLFKLGWGLLSAGLMPFLRANWMILGIVWAFLLKHKKPALIALGIALSVAIIAFAGWKVREGQKQRDALQTALQAKTEQVQILTSENAALKDAQVVHDVEVRTITIKEKAGREKTVKALAAHPEWRDTAVPSDVVDSLREDAD